MAGSDALRIAAGYGSLVCTEVPDSRLFPRSNDLIDEQQSAQGPGVCDFSPARDGYSCDVLTADGFAEPVGAFLFPVVPTS